MKCELVQHVYLRYTLDSSQNIVDATAKVLYAKQAINTAPAVTKVPFSFTLVGGTSTPTVGWALTFRPMSKVQLVTLATTSVILSSWDSCTMIKEIKSRSKIPWLFWASLCLMVLARLEEILDWLAWLTRVRPLCSDSESEESTLVRLVLRPVQIHT